MNYLDEIREMMREHGVEEINFLYHQNRPTIQRNGCTYEIMFIIAPDSGDEKLRLDGIMVRPSYVHKLCYLEMDGTWRKSSWKHVRDIVDKEIQRWEGECS